MRKVLAVIVTAAVAGTASLAPAQTAPGLVAGAMLAATAREEAALRGPSAWEHRVAFTLAGGVLGHMLARLGLRSLAGGVVAAPAGGGVGLGEVLTLSTSLSVIGVAIGATAGYLAGQALYPEPDGAGIGSD